MYSPRLLASGRTRLRPRSLRILLVRIKEKNIWRRGLHRLLAATGTRSLSAKSSRRVHRTFEQLNCTNWIEPSCARCPEARRWRTAQRMQPVLRGFRSRYEVCQDGRRIVSSVEARRASGLPGGLGAHGGSIQFVKNLCGEFFRRTISICTNAIKLYKQCPCTHVLGCCFF